MGFSLGDALNLRRMDAVNFSFVVSLLTELARILKYLITPTSKTPEAGY